MDYSYWRESFVSPRDCQFRDKKHFPQTTRIGAINNWISHTAFIGVIPGFFLPLVATLAG
jgi:hypothetical protein